VKKTARMALVAGLACLALTACGDRDDSEGASEPTPSETASSEATEPAADQFPDFKACMVSDSGGFDDKSFNQTGHDGLVAAADQFGVQTAEVESNSDGEYADNINAMVSEGCNSITTVGFLLGDATEAAAKKNPDVDFSIIDYAYEKPPANLKGLTFDTKQPSYLAGYLAAAESESGVVGTFGGLNIPTVTIFMQGFLEGINAYNDENGTDVKLLGWDGKDGSFTEDFEDKSKGQAIAQQMIQQGADIIFPVAGPAGLGGLQAAQDADARGIWVDTDGCVSAAEYCDILLTSVMKRVDVATTTAIKSAADGSFSNELYIGTLANEGVGLAPFHEQEDDIDPEVVSAIEDLKAQFIDGSLSID
jgi:basic membrane protein A and related proteins